MTDPQRDTKRTIAAAKEMLGQSYRLKNPAFTGGGVSPGDTSRKAP